MSGPGERSYDVVIVGSGAGGGTVAQALAPLVSAGKRVLVLEQGPRLADAEFTGAELEMAGELYADGGGFLTSRGTMTLAFAQVYGGSTVVYTGTSLTAPERVIRRWDVPGLGHADLRRRSQRYQHENNVHLLDAGEINDNNRLFVEGGRRAGYQVEQFPVNVKGCRGSSLCNLGCPNQAKQGTNRVQLPAAERAGVEIVTRAEALRIESDRSVLVRVAERPAGGKGQPSEWAPGEYRVHARVVVSAGGAIGSTALLLRSPLPRPRTLGARFTCHPALILVAEHSGPIGNDVGHPKSYFVDRAVEERFVLETCMYFPFTTAAGAARVHSPFAEPPLIERADAPRLEDRIAARRFQEGGVSISAAHLMGGCGMGRSAADSVTDAWGTVHGVPWLRVADAALFPDSLEINPYLTIMALADRVAEGVRRDAAALLG